MALKLGVGLTLSGELRDERATQPLKLGEHRWLTSGTGPDQADRLFADRRELTPGQVDNLDLAGDLADAFGRWLDAAELRALWIKALPSNGGDLLVGGLVGMFPNADATLRVKPGGILLLAAPGQDQWPVASPTDVLQVTNESSAAGAAYEIVLIGVSAPNLDLSAEGNPYLALLLE